MGNEMEISNVVLEEVEACPVCQQTCNKQICSDVEDFFFNTSKHLWCYAACLNCASIFLKNRPSKDVIGGFYDNYYTHAGEEMLSSTASFESLVIDSLKSIFRSPVGSVLARRLGLEARGWADDIVVEPGFSILDIGCGDGSLLESADGASRKLGVELDASAAANASSRGLEILLGGYEKLSEVDEKFDIIICSHVLEHVYHPTDLLKTICDSMEIGGQAWVQWPNPQATGLTRFGKYWRGFEAPRHLCLPSLSAIKQALEKVCALTGNNYRIKEFCKEYSSTSIYMNLAGRSARMGIFPKVRLLHRVLESARYLLSKKDEQTEFITIVLERTA